MHVPTSSKSAPGTLPREKQKLLSVYIYGLTGSDITFQSFPAHLYNLLSEDLDWVTHPKVNPKFGARQNTPAARGGFSTRLVRSGNLGADMISLGHPLRRILAVEVEIPR
ncbi:unnamed protein product, partial [Tuber aestivum]